MKNVYQEVGYKVALKREGHELMDEIKKMGVHKLTIYQWLGRELRWPEEKLHFSKLFSITDLELMVEALRKLHTQTKARRRRKPWKPRVRMVRVKQRVLVQTVILRPEEPKPKKEKSKFKAVVLPRPEYLRAMAELQEAQGALLILPKPTINPQLKMSMTLRVINNVLGFHVSKHGERGPFSGGSSPPAP